MIERREYTLTWPPASSRNQDHLSQIPFPAASVLMGGTARFCLDLRTTLPSNRRSGGHIPPNVAENLHPQPPRDRDDVPNRPALFSVSSFCTVRCSVPYPPVPNKATSFNFLPRMS